jgi:myo-inositol-1(or 4)-monophosphatase
MIEKIKLIAKTAGSIIRNGYKQSFEIELKTNESNLVTEIDKKAERTIIDFIKKEYPTHAIIAEESGIQKNFSEYTWVVDPLDGTTNFAHGLPIFSVSIGVTKHNEIIYGVVYDVMHDNLYSAVKGEGAFCNGKKIKVSENSNLRRSLLVTGFPYDIHENPNKAIQRFNRMLVVSRGIRRLGSAAIDFCYVADGVFDGFWEVFLNPWDLCAGKLILEEAGGKVTNLSGEKIDIFSNEILATNNKIHDQMIKELNSC